MSFRGVCTVSDVLPLVMVEDTILSLMSLSAENRLSSGGHAWCPFLSVRNQSNGNAGACRCIGSPSVFALLVT